MVHVFVYFNVWKSDRGWREKADHNTEATAVPQFSVEFDAWPHSVSHLVSLHLSKINLLPNFKKHNLMLFLNNKKPTILLKIYVITTG